MAQCECHEVSRFSLSVSVDIIGDEEKNAGAFRRLPVEGVKWIPVEFQWKGESGGRFVVIGRIQSD